MKAERRWQREGEGEGAGGTHLCFAPSPWKSPSRKSTRPATTCGGGGGGVREGEVALPRFQQPKSTRCRHQALKGCTQHLDRRRRASGRKRRPDPCAACPIRMFSSLKPFRCLPHQVATSSARQRRAQRPLPIRIALSSRPDSPAKTPRPMVWPAPQHAPVSRRVSQFVSRRSLWRRTGSAA